jgi:hypothetical protein
VNPWLTPRNPLSSSNLVDMGCMQFVTLVFATRVNSEASFSVLVGRRVQPGKRSAVESRRDA